VPGAAPERAAGWDGGDRGRDGGERPNRAARRRAEEHDEGHGDAGVHGVWFRMNVGRADRADPRWLVPLLCRRGRIEKADIGSIRILDGETRFEISSDVAGRFAAAVRRPDPREPWVRIVPMDRW
jgi:ATP-dependent RNA helicase DeaD